ncbi:type II toxin-antitoxin system HicB family antitoxin [Limimaricola hongkongensis]|uniref:type II toxin-antitoxin system HicB family antitoxin n=1 Tax=Limimaricola hongkongensis TaxID=278132 RepID=UPI00037C7F6D|nr:type II toxin-antitoxin system HicB family antitoxin [Limimaricola hongkongensis]
MIQYPMTIMPLADEDGGGYIAFFPDLPGCISDGETPEEAAKNGTDAFACWMEAQKEREADIPAPNSHQAERDAEFEAMAKSVAKLTAELERANERARRLERSGKWAGKSQRSAEGGMTYKALWPEASAVA